MTSAEFEDRALEAGVALLSGTGFGEYGEGYVRLSYATSQDNIKLALERLRNMVTKASDVRRTHNPPSIDNKPRQTVASQSHCSQ